MNLAIIDCGTNTFNLIVIRFTGNHRYERLFSTRIPVKLGENAINQGYIAETPFRRGIEAIESFSKEIVRFGDIKVLALATAAIRDASNGKQFVEEVKNKLNINIEVIDGSREAELIYFGIREAVKLDQRVSLIMDIGGGSTEFILANNENILWKQSFRIGAARLLEKFKHGNPISSQETEEIRSYLKEQLQPLCSAAKEHQPVELIGSSGAFESFIEMINGELGGEVFNPNKTEYNLGLNEYAQISELVRKSDLEQRRKIKGLVPMRFDMIVICCVMVDLILEWLNLSRMRVSTYSLKEGALVEYMTKLN